MRNVKQYQSKSNKIFKISAVFFIMSIATLGFLQMFFSNSLATSGEKLKSLEEEKRLLVMENELLANQIVEYSSLSRISSESVRLGMVHALNYLYTSIPVPLAMGARTQ